MTGTLASRSNASTCGSRVKPSSMPRKITLLVVVTREITGARLVAGRSIGVGVGWCGRPRPGTTGLNVVGGAVVVVGVVETVGTEVDTDTWPGALVP